MKIKPVPQEDQKQKKINALIKQVKWHVQANNANGVYDLVDQVYKLEKIRANELPEPYRTDLLNNIDFQRFALRHTGDPAIEAAIAMAEELSGFLFRMVVIEKDDINQADNVLQQYFFEKLTDGATLVDSSGQEYDNWQSLWKAELAGQLSLGLEAGGHP